MSKKYWDEYMKDELIKRGYEDANSIKFEKGNEKDDKEKFWVPVRRVKKDEKSGVEEITETGRIQCSLRIYPLHLADKNDQGVGRENPNNDPFLPPPEGRLELTLNPFKMFA